MKLSSSSRKCFSRKCVLYGTVFAVSWVTLSSSVAKAQISVIPTGSGSAADPYLIVELGNLAWMGSSVSNSADKYYRLMTDIDASPTSTWNDTGTNTTVLEGFSPVGTPSTPFIGVFDGDGHKITGLVINRVGVVADVGLFGYVGASGLVWNLGLAGGTVGGSARVGSMVGSNYGKVCYCYATSSVSATANNTGGLIGWNSGEVSDCHATGGVSGTANNVGGLIGYNYYGIVSNCYSTGSVVGSSYVGGLIGSKHNGAVSNCYASGGVTGSSSRGGLIGFDVYGTVSDSYWDTQTSGRSTSDGGTGKLTAQMKQQATFVGWNFTTIWDINENVSYPFLRMLPIDTDGDGVPDTLDNCVNVVNADQTDSDSDGYGNACDNCPHDANPDQIDADMDAIGDACDTCPNDPLNDPDQDGVCDSVDNCSNHYNPDQEDTDLNGIGDACELASILSAYSVKAHGNKGDFFVDVTSAGAVEGRRGGPTRIIVQFDEQIYQATNSTVDVSVSSGAVQVISISGSQLSVDLSEVSDKQWLYVAFPGILNMEGNAVTQTLCIGVISGDMSRSGGGLPDGIVNIYDLIYTKAALDQAVNGMNFRADVAGVGNTPPDGVVNIYDLIAIKTNLDRLIDPTRMARIPAGEFQMGDPFAGEGNSDELPRHAVYVDAFYMDRTEVTNQQYADALNWARNQGNLITVSSNVVYKYDSGTSYPYCDTSLSDSSSRITWNGSSFGVVAGEETHPMARVSWYGSVAYANWRSAMQGRQICYNLSDWSCDFSANGYRLPTEAEWEKAARGGAVGRRFPWSDSNTIQHARANYNSSTSHAYDTSPTSGYHPTFNTGVFPYTSSVEYFAPNGYGLYDMAGNVWEWCNDWYGSSYYTGSPYNNPQGSTTGSYRVLRGGGWGYLAGGCRVAYRSAHWPYYRGFYGGFRCATGT